MLPKSSADGAHAINFSWLLRLRWGAIFGQLGLIAGVRFVLDADLPLAPLLAIVAIEAASNLAFTAWLRRAVTVSPSMLGLTMGIDVVLLTGLLGLTGGPSNPFTTVYLVNIALAAVVLPPAWTWSLAALSVLCFGLLFLDVSTTDQAMHMGHGEHMALHLQGMWVAFALASGFIVYFVQRVTRALAAREAELAAAQARTARHEKLASLATLAAGAAHQLSTPLSTIAVVARELEHQLERADGGSATADGSAVADARLIREQVERCRDILQQLAADAGETTGEALEPTSVDELLRSAMRGLPAADTISVQIAAEARDGSLRVPPRALAQALRGVLKNACEASGPGNPVRIEVERDAREWRIGILDRGPGMSADVLARAGEPFFTTKGPDRGMGLGVFLARTVVEHLGGQFQLDSAPGRGTTARIILPSTPGDRPQPGLAAA